MINLNSKIYVTGHNGLVGSAILRKLKIKGFRKIYIKTRKELDLTNQNKVFRYLKKLKPDFIFIAAAKVGGIYSNNNFKAEYNKDFEEVIESCSNIKRLGQKGTWITSGLKESFLNLHEKGLAMSVEVWKDSKIVGGLYGLDLGHVFCGESMFSKSSNASKVALVNLSSELKKNNYKFIDCQIPTEHLKSMGGEEVSRDDFLKLLI